MTIKANIKLIVYRYNGHKTLKAEKKFTFSAEGIRAANAYVESQRQRYPKRAFVMLLENKVKRYNSEFRMKNSKDVPKEDLGNEGNVAYVTIDDEIQQDITTELAERILGKELEPPKNERKNSTEVQLEEHLMPRLTQGVAGSSPVGRAKLHKKGRGSKNTGLECVPPRPQRLDLSIVTPLNKKSPDSTEDVDEGLFYLAYRDLGN